MMMTTGGGHTVAAFDEEISTLRGSISEMGGRAEQALALAMTALKNGDVELAERVVADDAIIDALEAKVEQMAIQTIALRAPMADDLREIIASLKIGSVLERTGDYAKNIARRVPLLGRTPSAETISLLTSMSRLAIDLLHDALDAFAARDADLARAVTRGDRAVDDFYNSVFRTLLTYMMENPRSITESTHLMFIAKNLERVGDHATNISEMVYYVVTGETLEERERGSSPFDGDN